MSNIIEKRRELAEIRSKAEKLNSKESFGASEQREFDDLMNQAGQIARWLEVNDLSQPLQREQPEARGYGLAVGTGNAQVAGNEFRAGEMLGFAARDAGFKEVRAIANSANPGAAFSPPEYSTTVLDFLAAESAFLQSGVQTVRTNRQELKFPRLLTDPATAFYSEGGTISATDPTASTLTITPKKISGLVALSNEVIADSEPAVLDTVARSLIRSAALKFDLQAIEGAAGDHAFAGLANTADIQTVSMGTNGAALTNLDNIAAAITLLETENAVARVAIMHPRTWGALMLLKEQTSGSNKPLLQESAGSGSQGIQRSLYGVPVRLSSQMSITETQGTASNASSIYIFDTQHVMAVIRTDARFEVDSSRLFNTDQSEARVTYRAAIAVPYPKAVVRVLGIIPA